MTLLLIGLLALSFSTLKQIQEEWKTRGLTDTSYTALAGLITGGCVTAWAYKTGLPEWMVVVTAIGPSLGVWLFLWKLRDKTRTKFRIGH